MCPPGGRPPSSLGPGGPWRELKGFGNQWEEGWTQAPRTGRRLHEDAYRRCLHGLLENVGPFVRPRFKQIATRPPWTVTDTQLSEPNKPQIPGLHRRTLEMEALEMEAGAPTGGRRRDVAAAAYTRVGWMTYTRVRWFTPGNLQVNWRVYEDIMVQCGWHLRACTAFLYITPQWRIVEAVSDSGRALRELINGV